MAAELSGQVVVVLGGTAGLGWAGAMACVRAGARVLAVGRNPENVERAARELGSDGTALAGDACEPGCMERAIAEARKRWGRFDALYHIAGGSGRRHGDGPLHECSDAGWAYTLELNLSAMFRSNRAAVRDLLASGTRGAILNMGSVLALSPSPRHFATHAYAASKAAVIGMTRAAAACYAPRGIRFNVIAPSLFETPMARRAMQDEETMGFIRTKQPLAGGRVGRPEDLDAAVIALLGSPFLTGQVLAVDGGWSVSDGQITSEEKGWL